MTVSVVIPNWNGENLLKTNLPHVLEIGADEVIVVDDGSTDDSVETVGKFQKTNPKLQLIRNKSNVGFAKTVNKGVYVARGDVVVLLNTDVKPLPGLLEATLPHFKDQKVFGVSFSEEQWSWARGIWQDGFVEHEPGSRTDKPHFTFWVSGGSGAFRKSIWEKLGGFDPVFAPFYWEDMDLSYRAAKRGYKLLWNPNARVAHQHEETIRRYYSSDSINFIQERNRLLFIWKNITSPRMTRQHISALFWRIFKSPGFLRIVISALSKFPNILEKRMKESKQAKVSDEALFAQFKT